MLDSLKIMEALSNEDAVNLFFYAEKGIVSSTEAMRSLGLSQKRFYTRLKILLDAGLLEKTDEGYRHTFMGTLVHKLGLSLLRIIENKEQLEVLNSIQKDKTLSPEQTSQIVSALSIELPSLDMGNVKIISNFEDFVSTTIDIVNNAEKCIHIATQYIDGRVVEASIDVMNKGIEVKAIIDKMDQFTELFKLAFSLFKSPSLIKSFYNFLKNPITQIRLYKIPYTFMIIDNEKSMIEIKNLITGEFAFAVYILNKHFSLKLVNIFESIWEVSSDFKEKFQI